MAFCRLIFGHVARMQLPPWPGGRLTGSGINPLQNSGTMLLARPVRVVLQPGHDWLLYIAGRSNGGAYPFSDRSGDEQSLRYVVKMAYISSVDQYGKVEELPTGHGIADVVFVPKRRSTLPAMIVELKWDQSAEGAIKQIKDKNYPKALSQFGGELLLVGINYDEATKRLTCQIEKIMMN